MFCVKCGAPLEEGARFCVKCGAKAVTADGAYSQAADPTQPVSQQTVPMRSSGASAPYSPAGPARYYGSAAPASASASAGRGLNPTILVVVVAIVAVIVVGAVALLVFNPFGQSSSSSQSSSAAAAASAASAQAADSASTSAVSSSAASAAAIGQQPTNTTSTSAARSGDYILSDSANRYYSRSELQNMDLHDLYLARNEIYARHGRKFKNSDLQSYFSSKSWYTPRYSPEEFEALSDPLNDYERKNADLMLDIEKARNSPYL